MASKHDTREELKKQSRILLILALFLLVAVTTGVSYAFFNYTRMGTTNNIITTGTITFIYDEKNREGNGILISNSFPMSDTDGKKLMGNHNVFDFRVLATSSMNNIPYEITAKKRSDSDDIGSNVKLYLTEVDNSNEIAVPLTISDETVKHYNDLKQTKVLVTEGTVEKTIYTGVVPANATDYEKNFRLRMWISDDTSFSPTKDEYGNDVYPMNNKTFAVTINVYSNAPVVSVEE